MDVRCESCHTEYELDDGNVREGGTDVQCTFCGHTFTVYPTGAVPAQAGVAPAGGAAEFLLETGDGRTHRLRDLTVLQKWIIERKVTRTDRISRHGQPWARLGTLEDLAPFFDVVDEADRARAASGRSSGSHATSGSLGAPMPTREGHAPSLGSTALAGGSGSPPQPSTTPGAPPRVPGAPFAAVPTMSYEEAAPRTTTPEGQRAVNRSLEMMAVEAGSSGTTDADPSVVVPRPSRAWWKLLVTFSVAGVVAYFGIRALPQLMMRQDEGQGIGRRVGTFLRERTGVATDRPVREPTAEPATPAAQPGGDPLAADVGGAAVTDGGTAAFGAGTGTIAATTSAVEALAPATAPPVDAGSAIAMAPGAARVGGPTRAMAESPATSAPEADPAPTPAAPTRARAAKARNESVSYERLIEQADNLLGNGQNERALRLYERALAARPDAPEALTGIGYVHLDRNRTGAAIEYFTRASGKQPFAPALFGLGQAYRAAGDPGRARHTYQRYLSLYPSGADAPAAERQLQSMSGGSGSGVSVGEAPASILDEGRAEPRTGEARGEARPAAAPDAGK